MSNELIFVFKKVRVLIVLFCVSLSVGYANEISFVEKYEIAKTNEINMLGPIETLLTQDGQHVYVSYSEVGLPSVSGQLTHFSRDVHSGDLSFVESKVHSIAGDGLAFAGKMLLAPDEKFLYLAGGEGLTATLAIFERNIEDGSLVSNSVMAFDGDGLPEIQRIKGMVRSNDGRFILDLKTTS